MFVSGLGLVLGACGDGPTTAVQVGSESASTTAPGPTTRAPASPTTTATTTAVPGPGARPTGCTVAPGATGPVFDAELELAHGARQPGQPAFDWDGDGAADALRFDRGRQAVVVDHGRGRFRVVGVPSDFGDELYPGAVAAGVELDLPDLNGPPSRAAVLEGRAGPTPAAITDLTGDGQPDLAVYRDGELTVFTATRAERTGSATAAPSSRAGASWSSPRRETDLPLDVASVVPIGDIDGDGAGDLRVDSYAPRGSFSPAFYFGKPCR